MKKILILFLAFGWVPAIKAQNVYGSLIEDFSLEFPNALASTIVRSTGKDSVYVYLRDGEQAYLYGVKHAIPPIYGMAMTEEARKVKLDSSWVIKDMRIFGKMALLCGSYNDQGFYACAYITNFMSSAYLQVFHCHLLSEVTCINTMLPYKYDFIDAGIVASEMLLAGEAFDEEGNKRDCLIMFSNMPSNASLPYARKMLPKGEKVAGLVKTSNRIAVVIRDYEDYQYAVKVRCTDFDSPLFSSNLDIVYKYNIPQDQIWGNVYPSILNPEKEMALVYIGHNSMPELRMLIVSVEGSMQALSEQAVIVEDKSDPIGLVYSPIDQTLIVLKTMHAAVPRNKFLMLKPYANPPYYSDMLYFNTIDFTSLDTIKEISFVAAGYDKRYYHSFDLNFDEENSCARKDTIAVVGRGYPQCEQAKTNLDHRVFATNYFYYWNPIYVIEPHLMCRSRPRRN